MQEASRRIGWSSRVSVHLHGMVRRGGIKEIPYENGIVVRTTDNLKVIKL
jgi:hypothetical protein